MDAARLPLPGCDQTEQLPGDGQGLRPPPESSVESRSSRLSTSPVSRARRAAEATIESSASVGLSLRGLGMP